ncbi:MAG: hypothetical protein PHF94_04655 [Methanothrix sp.]|nr:hypothetical protein [Methanothrix sp.]
MSKPLSYNRPAIFLALMIIIQAGIMSASGLTDLDYSLRKLKYSEGSLSEEQSFHGANSAKLSVFDKNRYARIYINLKNPLFIDNLDQFNMWINPQLGTGSIQIEIRLEGGEKIVSQKKSLDEIGLSSSQWNEVDAFDLEYKDCKSLDDLKLKLKGKKITKIYVSYYNTGNSGVKATAFFDYIRIGNEVISFEVLEEEDVKDGPSSATPGGLMTYTITYANNGLEPADVIVREDYDSRTVFVSSFPKPDYGTFNIWTFHDLAPGAHGQITIKMRTLKPAAKASISGSVTGRGYASTEGLLSTEAKSYMITNTVYITAGEFNHSASVSTRIRPIVGSTLKYGEHGSGDYRANEELAFSSTSIHAERSILASTSPVSFNFTVASPLRMDGDWTGTLQAENDYRDLLWKDRYHDAKSLNLSYEAHIGKTLSYLETSAQVEGLVDRIFRWPEGFAETSMAGDFNLTGEARWRWANKSIAPDKEWLQCCPLGGEGLQP